MYCNSEKKLYQLVVYIFINNMIDLITQNRKFILILVVLIVLAILKRVLEWNGACISIPWVNPKYVIKPYFFSIAEKEFYKSLKKILSYNYWSKYEVYPKVRLADILKSEKWDKWWKRLAYRHIDFLIVDSEQDFKPMLAIELDWDSHRQYRQIKSDKFKDEALKNSNLPLRRFNNSISNNEEIIRMNIAQYLWTPTEQNT